MENELLFVNYKNSVRLCWLAIILIAVGLYDKNLVVVGIFALCLTVAGISAFRLKNEIRIKTKVKVKELIAVLQRADPEMDVCNFSDFSVSSVEDVGIYNGDYKAPLGLKLIMEQKKGEYVGLGNPGDFDGLDIYSVKDLITE